MKLTAALATAAAAAAAVSADTIAPTAGQHLCCAANQDRAKGGVKALQWYPALDTIAVSHSQYQLSTDEIGHFEVAGSSSYGLADRLATVHFNYKTAGENLAEGPYSISGMQTAWMASEGHRANIMNSDFTVCGGGISSSGYFYTVDFASPFDEADASNFYTLSCSNGMSLGATRGATATPSPVASATSAAAEVPERVVHSPQSATTSAAAASPSPVASPVAASPATQVQAEDAVVASASATAPAAVSPGKCKRVPKGSIAAGKCKPCKQCGSANRRRRQI
ncbi:hypothetical protein H4217_001771 [Coemansia sp. RSA 1939]|nr:hypothetical protein H4217_001771 [Coemansia sp. RSA 1939]KAJ2615356.1 hypothetical protein EV177_001611 [Coemansia sp. RSA 1804]KAJ2691920.1 hypothetical protein GGH99_002071 [Coemansia sp. RSA 1285]